VAARRLRDGTNLPQSWSFQVCGQQKTRVAKTCPGNATSRASQQPRVMESPLRVCACFGHYLLVPPEMSKHGRNFRHRIMHLVYGTLHFPACSGLQWRGDAPQRPLSELVQSSGAQPCPAEAKIPDLDSPGNSLLAQKPPSSSRNLPHDDRRQRRHPKRRHCFSQSSWFLAPPYPCGNTVFPN
jgi:hypothetical protein